MSKEEKIKIPKIVKELRWSPKKFAKKHGIRVKADGMSKRDRKRAQKQLIREYSKFAIEGLDKAVRILIDLPEDHRKIGKITSGVENIITNPEVMKRIAKIYKRNRDNYKNLVYLPHMILLTIAYYNRPDLSAEEAEIKNRLDSEGLVVFCEKILKKSINVYENAGLSREAAFRIAAVIPTGKIFKRNGRKWFKNLIRVIYDITEKEAISLDAVFKAVIKLSKSAPDFKKTSFFEKFFAEFMLNRLTNKNHKFNDNQKDLHELLVERTLEFLNGIKGSRCKDMLRTYIKRRKKAEEFKNDTKRVIKFIDYATANSEYKNLRDVLTELISDNSNNEIYLG